MKPGGSSAITESPAVTHGLSGTLPLQQSMDEVKICVHTVSGAVCMVRGAVDGGESWYSNGENGGEQGKVAPERVLGSKAETDIRKAGLPTVIDRDFAQFDMACTDECSCEGTRGSRLMSKMSLGRGRGRCKQLPTDCKIPAGAARQACAPLLRCNRVRFVPGLVCVSQRSVRACFRSCTAVFLLQWRCCAPFREPDHRLGTLEPRVGASPNPRVVTSSEGGTAHQPRKAAPNRIYRRIASRASLKRRNDVCSGAGDACGGPEGAPIEARRSGGAVSDHRRRDGTR